MPVTTATIVSAIAAVVGTGAAVKNQQQKREWEQALATLNFEEKKRLEEELKKSKDAEEKRKVLTDALGKITEQRLSAIEQKKAESQKTLNKLLIIGGVATTILVVGLIIVYQKRKK